MMDTPHTHPTRPATLGIAMPTRLAAEIWLWRWGWAWPLAAVVLALSVLVGLTQLWPLQQQRLQLEAELDRMGAAARPGPSLDLRSSAAAESAVPAVMTEVPLHSVLSHRESVVAQLQQLSDTAAGHGIDLPKGQYHWSRHAGSGVERTEVSFQFQAGYAATRAYLETVLLNLPHASLDRVAFERQELQGLPGSSASIQVRLALWAAPGALPPTQTHARTPTGASSQTPGDTPPAPTPRVLVTPRHLLVAPPGPDDRSRDILAMRLRPLVPAALAPAVAAAEPVAPPAPPPFRFLGKQRDANGWVVFLERQNQSFIVRENDSLEAGWQVGPIKPPRLTITRGADAQHIEIGDWE